MHEYHYIRYHFVRRSDCTYIVYHGPVGSELSSLRISISRCRGLNSGCRWRPWSSALGTAAGWGEVSVTNVLWVVVAHALGGKFLNVQVVLQGLWRHPGYPDLTRWCGPDTFFLNKTGLIFSSLSSFKELLSVIFLGCYSEKNVTGQDKRVLSGKNRMVQINVANK